MQETTISGAHRVGDACLAMSDHIALARIIDMKKIEAAFCEWVKARKTGVSASGVGSVMDQATGAGSSKRERLAGEEEHSAKRAKREE